MWRMRTVVKAGTEQDDIRLQFQNLKYDGAVPDGTQRLVENFALGAVLGEHAGSVAHPEKPVDYTIEATGSETEISITVKTGK